MRASACSWLGLRAEPCARAPAEPTQGRRFDMAHCRSRLWSCAALGTLLLCWRCAARELPSSADAVVRTSTGTPAVGRCTRCLLCSWAPPAGTLSQGWGHAASSTAALFSNRDTSLHVPVRQAAVGGRGAEEAPADTGLLPAFVKSFVMARPWCCFSLWAVQTLLFTRDCIRALQLSTREHADSVCACRSL